MYNHTSLSQEAQEVPEAKKHMKKNTQIALLLWFILATIGIVMSLSTSGTASSGTLKEDKILQEIKMLRLEVNRLEKRLQ